MIQDDEDDDWDFNPFVASAEIKKRELLLLSQKPASSLTPKEIFSFVKSSVSPEKFIPAALSLIASGRDLDLDPGDDEWQILSRQEGYFRKNHKERKRYDRLFKNRFDLNPLDVGVRRKCGHCTDGSGALKNLYPTRDAAVATARKRDESSSIRLEPYECPRQPGWHLAKARSV